MAHTPKKAKRQPTPKRKDRSNRAPAWVDGFLSTLSETGNVSEASRVSGFSRRDAYRYRDEMPNFAAAWDDAVETAVDYLEAEARRRAKEGVERYVIGKGEVVTDPETGGPLKMREHSDALMGLLLRAHRPDKYREKNMVDISALSGLAALMAADKGPNVVQGGKPGAVD